MPGLPENKPILIEPEGLGELEELLRHNGCNTSSWGVGSTKSLAALWGEIAAGESDLVLAESGLWRRARVVALDVFAEVGPRCFYLREYEQTFSDGSTRHRHLSTSLGEKMKRGETVEVATQRALVEELGVKAVKMVEWLGVKTLQTESSSYPDLPTELELNLLRVDLYPADFKAEGYVERQPSKTTFFRWESVELE